MQVTKYAFFLVLGISAQACGGGSDGDGGDGDPGGGNGGASGASTTGGSTGNGGSSGASTTGGSTGNGGSSGASTTGGSTGNGGSSGASTTGGSTGNGGSTSTGGSTGTGGAGGGCMAGEVDLLDDPACEDFFTCYFEAICASQGAQQQACVDATKQALASGACAPAGSDTTAACTQLKTIYAMQFPECQ